MGRRGMSILKKKVVKIGIKIERGETMKMSYKTRN
jgi:hypothetical protein